MFFTTICIVLHMHSIRICSFKPCLRFRVKFPLGKKKEIDSVDRNEIRIFFSISFRNAEHVASTSVYTQVHVISFRQSDRASSRSSPDGQTRLGRVNQRVGDLNQWRRHICWQRLMIRRTRMSPGLGAFRDQTD